MRKTNHYLLISSEEARVIITSLVNRFPRDTELYKLMTTKPGEGVFGGGNENE